MYQVQPTLYTIITSISIYIKAYKLLKRKTNGRYVNELKLRSLCRDRSTYIMEMIVFKYILYSIYIIVTYVDV